MTQLTETELVDSCKCGQRAAQSELYRRYSRAMFGTCLRMLKSREDAEDVLQASFTDVFVKFHHYRGDASVGSWIKRIVVNNCLNHLKKRQFDLVELTDTVQPITYSKRSESDEEFSTKSYTVNRVKTAVANLPLGYRTVLNLYLFEGYDHAEIAQVLDISEQTSKSQYSRARQKLRTQLTG